MSASTPASPYVRLKDGNGPPILIAHGLSGTVQVSNLARSIQTPYPIYGIQALGVDGADEPLDRIEHMATYYLRGLEELCPEGPYILIGYSFGGLVALEMAQRLREEGKQIPLLVMLDAYPHSRFLRLPTRLNLYVRRLRTHFRDMSRMAPRAALSYLKDRIANRLRLAKIVDESESCLDAGRFSISDPTLRQVKEKAYVAYSNYRPRYYAGKVAFVTSETKTFFPTDPTAVWKHLTAGLEIDAVPGDHLNIIGSEVASLAALLTRYIERVPSVSMSNL